MKRTAIYMRVSTERQATDGQSLGFQRGLLTEYVESRPDLILVGEYMDEGVSGAKFDQRDELQRMLSDVKAGKIDLILFTKLDRFFRSVRHLMNTLDTLEQCGCEWKAIQENHDNTTPVGKLSITIMGAFAQMESDMDSVRIKDAFQHKKSKKEWLNGHVPFGYRLVDKHAVPDPDRAEAARDLFRQYLRHNNISKLTRDNATRYGKVLVVTGPVFSSAGERKTIGKNEVVIPDAFYKVLLVEDDGLKGVGFYCENVGSNAKEAKSHARSIDEIEEITGIDFFHKLPDDIEERVESAYDWKHWNTGGKK